MSFANKPMLNLLLATVLLLSWFLWWEWRKRRRAITQFVRGRLLAQLTVGVSTTRQKLRLVLLVAAVAGVMLALARPQWGYTWEEVKQSGLDIVVAVDTSRSMLAEDLAPNRLTRAKLAALELAAHAKTDRLGLVAFAGTAFLQCPLTLDDEAYRQSVNSLDVGIIPQGGTALAEAIRTAISAYKDDSDNQKVLVLMTDGEDHEEGAVEAARTAAKAGMRIFTLGIGTSQGEMLRITETNGTRNFLKDGEGNAVKSRLNDLLLQEIAAAANGRYLPLRGANAIDLLYEQGLAPLLGRTKLAGAKNPVPAVQKPQERFQWPLGLAILVLILEIFFPERRLVKRPEQPLMATAQPELAKLAGLLFLTLVTVAEASPDQAKHLYETGQYQRAWKEYQRLLQAHPKDMRLAFNAGAAAYKAKAFDEAVGLFSDALIAPDVALQQQAYYNLGNTQYRLGEQAEEPAQKQSNWEEAIKSYDSALQLKPQDADAKYNLDYVKKRLEELKKQQEEKQKEDSKDQKDKDQKDKDQKDQKEQKDKDKKEQKDANSDSNKQEQQKQDQQKQEQPKPDQQKEDQQKKEQQKQEQQKSEQSKADQAKKDQEKKGQASEQKKQSGETNQNHSAESAMMEGRMTLQQALQLLDALKNEEKALIIIPPEDKQSGPRIFKDW